MSAYVLDGRLVPAGYQQLTILGSASALTVPAGTKLTMIQAEAQAVRYRDDGTDPTASVGMVIAAGQTVAYNGNPSAVKIIESTAGAKVNVLYYKV